MKNIFSKNDNRLYSIIELIRTRPVMYLGTPSIKSLHLMIQGYIWACDDHDVEDTSHIPLPVFTAWLAQKYQIKFPLNWDGLLFLINFHNEIQALDAFFTEWDEFCALDPEMLKKDFIDENGNIIHYPPKYWPKEEEDGEGT